MGRPADSPTEETEMPVERSVTKSELDEIRRPLLEASNLPAACYTAREWYDREIAAIFLKEWHCVGRVEQLEQPGAYFTVELAGEPIIVVRGADGEVRALSGACRHRGTELTRGEGHARSFRCPYHAWTYSLTGELLGAPGMKDVKGFDRGAYCLPRFTVEIWEGFIFVNLDAASRPLAPRLEGLARRLAPYRLRDQVCTWRIDYEVACNWKVFMDGQEGYHLTTVHGDSITSSMGKDACDIEEPHGAYEVILFRNIGTLARRTLTGESPFPLIEGLPEAEMAASPYAIVYPTFQLAVSIDGVSYLYVFPEGPERSRVFCGICFPRDTVKRPDFAEVAEQYYRRWDIVMKEDLAVCEMSQRGLRSRFFPRGRYAPLEPFVHRFHNYVLDRVG
jgi:phenylpropionate dioxygenase-like ring-hydroxylating dioxygenase large terminal subunit